jgi:hypothetical protein
MRRSLARSQAEPLDLIALLHQLAMLARNDRLQAGDIIGQSLAGGSGSHPAIVPGVSMSCAHYAARSGAVRMGRRQSMPSRSIDSCAGLSDADPLFACGRMKRPRSSRLGRQAQPITVPPEHLDQITAVAAEHEQMTAERIGIELGLDQCCQTVEAAAHVGDPGGEPDAGASR